MNRLRFRPFAPDGVFISRVLTGGETKAVEDWILHRGGEWHPSRLFQNGENGIVIEDGITTEYCGGCVRRGDGPNETRVFRDLSGNGQHFREWAPPEPPSP